MDTADGVSLFSGRLVNDQGGKIFPFHLFGDFVEIGRFMNVFRNFRRPDFFGQPPARVFRFGID